MFTVVAGKYDMNERNYKYIDSFYNFDDALDALEQVKDYPFSYMEYTHDGKVVTLAIF